VLVVVAPTPTPPLGPVELVPEVPVPVAEVLVGELLLVDVELLVLEVEVGVVLVVVVVWVVLVLVEVEALGVVVVWLLPGRHWVCASWETLVANSFRSLRSPGSTDCTAPTAFVSPWLALVTAPHWPL
jgi:hypothetical protein